ncbi:MAG: SGNH/GDSL hydrolase family protein [Clostridia bacterium]|nr:SGNH/GDSL hydrolase family protein [Clostridia bacterium]
MKRTISLLLSVIVLLSVLTGCNISGGEKSYDYKDSYDRLYQSVMEQEYAIDALENGTAGKFAEGEICVCFGDSLLGLPESGEDYASVIAAETGLTTVNAGFGAASIAKNPNEAYDAFSLCRLVNAVVNGDWTLQDARVAELPLPNSAARLAALKEVDWSKVSVVTLGMGLNDINDGYVIENAENAKDITTVKGALRYSIETLLTKYPHLKIMVLTPTYRYMYNSNVGCDEILYNGSTYEQYIDAIISVAEEYKLPYIDLYRTLGFNAYNFKYYYLEGDGTHLNSKGNTRIGKRISNELLREFN